MSYNLSNSAKGGERMYADMPSSVLGYFEKENIKLFCADEVDSTNKRARIYAEQMSEPPERAALFLAESQSEGRGRLGRSFFSPANTGLYMTLLIPSPKRAESFARLTALTAVATAEAVRNAFAVEPRIKWVNDLYLDGKKVAGILAESFPVGELRYVAVGIGINLTTDEFPEDIHGKAGSLTKGIESDELCARKTALAFLISKKLLASLEKEESSEQMKKYRELSCVIGKRISFSLSGEKKEGIAVDINDDGALVVQLGNGQRITLSTGEISVFSLDGKWN